MSALDVFQVTWVATAGWGLLVLLFYSFYRFYQESLIDECRQKIFIARDEIFYLAAQNKIEAELHEKIRDDLNMFIRYAHKITWPRIFVAVMFNRKKGKAPGMLTAVESILDQDAKVAVRRCVIAAVKAIFDLLIRRSLVLELLFRVLHLKRRLEKLVKVDRAELVAASASIVSDASDAESVMHMMRTREACGA